MLLIKFTQLCVIRSDHYWYDILCIYRSFTYCTSTTSTVRGTEYSYTYITCTIYVQTLDVLSIECAHTFNYEPRSIFAAKVCVHAMRFLSRVSASRFAMERRIGSTRHRRSCSSTRQSIRERLTGFLAGITHGSNGLNFEDTYDLLQEVPERDLAEWEKGHFEDHAQIIRYGSEDVTVIDTMIKDEVICPTALRTLIFNRRVDLQQSRSFVQWTDGMEGEEVFDFSSPDSLIRGLAVATGIATHATAYPREGSVVTNICVLGGGGCTLSMYLRDCLPHRMLEINTVEISSDVRFAAREFFGVAQVERQDSAFRLVDDCAIEWTLKRSAELPESIDVLVVDIESGEDAEFFDAVSVSKDVDAAAGRTGGQEKRCWLAPPKRFLSSAFLRAAHNVLKPAGCICINTIASTECFEEMCASVRDAGFVSVSCVVPSSRQNRQRLLLCVREGDATVLSPKRIEEAALAHPELFPENFCEWVLE